MAEPTQRDEEDDGNGVQALASSPIATAIMAGFFFAAGASLFRAAVSLFTGSGDDDG